MEAGMSLNALVLPHLSSSSSRFLNDSSLNHSLFSIPRLQTTRRTQQQQQQRHVLVVEAKGKRGMMSGKFQRPPPPPPLPKIEDDGNPKFVIFIRMAEIYIWYPLSIVSGGTTAKIMVAAKDNFLGKYIYKDTLDRNLAAVIYRDEKEIQQSAFKQYRVLQSATRFRYGYKLVENGNVRAALSTSNIIELPTPDKLKTVVDKVKDFFQDVKGTFRDITSFDNTDDSKKRRKRKN
ncbi:Protein hhl1, chloroplastic [Trifolium repens]|nr:Protein hhl1, chloroplastic [Trifolium repens]